MKMNAHWISQLIAFTLCIIGLSSCGDLQQDLYLKADGSGTLETTFDMGEFMSMMGELDGLSPDQDTLTDDHAPDTISTNPPTQKDVMTLFIETISNPEHTVDVDTIMPLISLMPDSIRQKETRLDIAEKIDVRLRSPANSANVSVGILMDFENKIQLEEMIEYFQTMDQGTGMIGNSSPMSMESESFLSFDMNLKEGWIKIDTMSYGKVVSEFGISQDSSATGEDLGMMEMMFGNSKIRTVIHVPGEVLSCTNKNAILTKDNRVIVEFPFMDAINKGQLDGFTIAFAPQK